MSIVCLCGSKSRLSYFDDGCGRRCSSLSWLFVVDGNGGGGGGGRAATKDAVARFHVYQGKFFIHIHEIRRIGK